MSAKNRKTAKSDDARRQLMAVSKLLEDGGIQQLILNFSRPLVLSAIREALEWYRAKLGSGQEIPDKQALINRVEFCLQGHEAARFRPVVNATGIILHTGLGRAVLPQRAVDALAGLNRCCNLQIDLETGLRGKRDYMCGALLAKITGAEAAIIVNNNAAATFFLLSALCKDKEVIISRGQLIEIGGSFRLPDCIHQSGAKMVEVGTTNKTHLRDYERALNDQTGMILRVNPSNYRVVGFAQEVGIADLVSLKKIRPVTVVDDLGCGALLNLEKYGLPKEPTVQESIAAGADLVCFSGDKLVGGPQAGIILGKKEFIHQLKQHPLSRMLRVGKLTDMALEHTLRLFLEPETLAQQHPTMRMLTTPVECLRQKAAMISQALEGKKSVMTVQTIPGESAVGGGSLPSVSIPTMILAVSATALSPDQLSARLRRNQPPIIARIANDQVQMDMRTLMDGDAEIIISALRNIREELTA